MYRSLVALAGALTLMTAAPASAATLLWSSTLGTSDSNFEYSVDQLVADGSGGCVVVVSRYDLNMGEDSVIVVRLDKKGATRWTKTYTDTWDAEISYIDKKVAVYSLDSNVDNETVRVVDIAGTETTISESGVDVTSDMNGEMGPTGDKKGFFVVVRDDSGPLVLRRYTYK